MTVHPEVAPAGSSKSTGRQAAGDTAPMSSEPKPETPSVKGRQPHSQRTETILRSLATAAGATIVGAIALIALFLLIRAVPSVMANEANFFTSAEFSTTNADHLRFGIRD